MKKLVYICSPCRGDYEKNIDNAATYSHAAFTRGYIPITPHIYFTRFVDDTNSKERSMAMEAGSQLLLMCSEVWVFGLDHPSEGMQAEIAIAIRHGIPIIDGDEILRGRHERAQDEVLKELRREPVLRVRDPEAEIAEHLIMNQVLDDFEKWITKNFGRRAAKRWEEITGKHIKVIHIRTGEEEKS